MAHIQLSPAAKLPSSPTHPEQPLPQLEPGPNKTPAALAAAPKISGDGVTTGNHSPKSCAHSLSHHSPCTTPHGAQAHIGHPSVAPAALSSSRPGSNFNQKAETGKPELPARLLMWPKQHPTSLLSSETSHTPHIQDTPQEEQESSAEASHITQTTGSLPSC